MSQFCTNCGAPIPDDSKFCEACGARVEPEAPAAEQGGYAEEPQKIKPEAYEQAPGSGTSRYADDPVPKRPSGPAFPGASAPAGPQKSGGGIPKGALIGGVAVIAVAAVAGIFTLRGKKDDGGKAESTAVQTETTMAAVPSGSTGTGNAGGSTGSAAGASAASEGAGTGGLTAAEQAALIEQGMDAISGGVKAGDAEQIKIPEGAQVKTDAMLTDLIGEYKGEIQLTKIEGYENMPNLPEDFEEIKADGLTNPRRVTLEIEEDGNWDIFFSLVGMTDFDTDDFDDDEEFTPAEVDALKITTLSNGMYHAKMDKSYEDKSGSGSMKMDHIGAYCVNGDDRMIAGKFAMNMIMGDMDVKLEGDFLAHKTTEDYMETQTEEYAQTAETKPAEEETEAAAPAESTAAASEGSGSVTTDALGRKAAALAKNDEKKGSSSGGTSSIQTVSGGEWIQIASVWFYQKDGELVKNSWIDDNGVYYYVDETGYMLSNAYTPDGYYVGPDGSYDPNAPENKNGGSTSSVEGTAAGDAMAAIAAKLSTTESAHATEFDWFIDYVNETGYGMDAVITDPNQATRMTDLQGALNGGWKCFMFTKKGDYGSDVERYLNASVEASGGKFNITLNWDLMLDPAAGESIQEQGSSTYRGTYDDAAGTATAMSDDSKIDFDAFYLSKDGKTEYAVGTFTWISGEKERIALMRSAK